MATTIVLKANNVFFKPGAKFLLAAYNNQAYKQPIKRQAIKVTIAGSVKKLLMYKCKDAKFLKKVCINYCLNTHL